MINETLTLLETDINEFEQTTGIDVDDRLLKLILKAQRLAIEAAANECSTLDYHTDVLMCTKSKLMHFASNLPIHQTKYFNSLEQNLRDKTELCEQLKDNLTKAFERELTLKQELKRLRTFVKLTIDKWDEVDELQPTIDNLKRVLRGDNNE